MVYLGGLPGFELLVESLVSPRRAGQRQYAACLAVQAMHDPQVAELRRQDAGYVRRIQVVAIRQGEQAGGFVDDQQGIIGVENEVGRLELSIVCFYFWR